VRSRYGVLLLVALTACDNVESQSVSEQVPVRPTPHRVIQSDSIQTSRYSAIVTAAARVAPAVVSVNVTRRARRGPRTTWEQFFIPRGSEHVVEGFGSGFVITSDGIVITNQHVTAGAQEIVVTTRDGTDYDAQLLGEDPLTDIAVLKIDGRNLPTAPIGGSTDLVIGEWVIAIGNPYSYLLGNTEPTVTAGVVSAVGRDLVPSGENSGVYVGMIQTDAAINPGNSGGPLINALGEVVGVNASIFSNTGGSVGIGFAIPIERALRVSNELSQFGMVRRSWTGLDVAGADDLRRWKSAGGLVVTEVAPNSPADRAGLREGDVLVTADAHSTRTYLDWEAVKLDVGPGDTVNIAYRRGGQNRMTTVIVEDLPTTGAERISTLGDIELITLTPAIRQERGLEYEHGALIYEIGDNARRNTGLQPGDLIVQVNRERISRAEDVTELFESYRGRRSPLRVYVERGGTVRYSDFYVGR
jgi:serine protease Do